MSNKKDGRDITNSKVSNNINYNQLNITSELSSIILAFSKGQDNISGTNDDGILCCSTPSNKSILLGTRNSNTTKIEKETIEANGS